MSMYDKTRCNIVISLQLIKINGKKRSEGEGIKKAGGAQKLGIGNMDIEIANN